MTAINDVLVWGRALPANKFADIAGAANDFDARAAAHKDLGVFQRELNLVATSGKRTSAGGIEQLAKRLHSLINTHTAVLEHQADPVFAAPIHDLLAGHRALVRASERPGTADAEGHISMAATQISDGVEHFELNSHYKSVEAGEAANPIEGGSSGVYI